MKEKALKYLQTIFIIVFVAYCYYSFVTFTSEENEEFCKMKAMDIKGVVEWKGGHGIYNYVKVDNIELSFMVSIRKAKYLKGFPSYYNYEVGDSIIKEAGSEEFTIKRGDSIAVHVIGCDEW